MTPSEILAENRLRRDKLFSLYDPRTGVGSLIPRFDFYIDDETKIMLPNSMLNMVSDFHVPGKKTMRDMTKSEFRNMFGVLTNMRIREDFEYWASTCVFIQDKESGQEVNFKLRLPQRMLLKVIIELFWAQTPIRIVLLKARQWGGSTLVQMFMAWLQLFHFENWHSVIIGDVEEQARTIRAMYSRMAIRHPVEVQPVTFASFERSAKNRIITERGCIVSIGSMQKPEGNRSSDVKLIHKSEVGSWKETKGKKPEDLIMALSGIPLIHGTLDVEESTAKGMGNYFHKSWTQAMDGSSARVPVFIPWYCIDMYQIPIYNQKDLRDFAEKMDDYTQFLWSEGATLEGINWYYWKRKTEGMDAKEDHWRMQADFPTTHQEAFQSTGRRAFSPQYVKNAGKHTCDPEFVGEVYGEANFGKNALNNIDFHKTANGKLSIWDMPDTDKVYRYRYVVSVDIGGRTDKADYSVIRVLDRLPLLEGAKPVFILTWRGHLDQDLVVWKAAQIAKAYGYGLLVPETNSLDKVKSEGDHFLTVLNEIVEFYDEIYCRTSPEQIKQGAPKQYGFHVGRDKVAMIDHYNAQLRECSFIELDKRVVIENDCYEIKADGKLGAVDGQHDDLVMPSAEALYVAKDLPLPIEIIRNTKRTTKKIISEATM